MLDLRAVQAAVPPGLGELEAGLSRIAERVAGVFDQVREISHGIHPAILSERGLQPALKALARRSAVPVELDLRVERRLPDHVEVAAYYAVSACLRHFSASPSFRPWLRRPRWRQTRAGRAGAASTL